MRIDRQAQLDAEFRACALVDYGTEYPLSDEQYAAVKMFVVWLSRQYRLVKREDAKT